MPAQNRDCRPCEQTICRFFPGLGKEERKQLFQGMCHVTYRKKEVLYEKNEPASWSLLIGQGEAELVQHSLRGKRCIIQRFGPGDLLGIEALFDGGAEVRQYAAEALTPLHAWLIKRGEFYDLLRRYPECAVGLIQSFTAAIHERDLHISSLLAENAEEKIAGVLYLQCCQQQRWFGQSNAPVLQLTNAQIGGLVGCCAETASKMVSNLQRKQALIRQNGSILLGQPSTLGFVS